MFGLLSLLSDELEALRFSDKVQEMIMATYSTNKKLIKISKLPFGRYIGAGFVGKPVKRLKVVTCWREKELNILLIGIS